MFLKRVETLEFEKEKTKVVKGADAKSVELVYKLGPFESNAVSMLMDKYETSVFVNEYAPVPDVHAAQALVNESVVSWSVIEYKKRTSLQCPQLKFIEKQLGFFFSCKDTQKADSSEIDPVRHVSFAETGSVGLRAT